MRKSHMLIVAAIVFVVGLSIGIVVLMQLQTDTNNDTNNTIPKSEAVTPKPKTTVIGDVEYVTGKDLQWPDDKLPWLARPNTGALTAITTDKEKNTIRLTIEGVSGSDIVEYTKMIESIYSENAITNNSGFGITFKGSINNKTIEFLFDAASATAIIRADL